MVRFIDRRRGVYSTAIHFNIKQTCTALQRDASPNDDRKQNSTQQQQTRLLPRRRPLQHKPRQRLLPRPPRTHGPHLDRRAIYRLRVTLPRP